MVFIVCPMLPSLIFVLTYSVVGRLNLTIMRMVSPFLSPAPTRMQILSTVLMVPLVKTWRELPRIHHWRSYSTRANLLHRGVARRFANLGLRKSTYQQDLGILPDVH